MRHPTLPSQVATSPRACADSYTSVRVPPSCLSSSRRLHGTIGSTPLTRIVQAHTVHCHRLLPCMHQPRNRREAGPRSHRVTLPREGGRTALACVSTRNVQSRKKPPSKCAVRLNSCSTASPCRQPSLLPDDAAFVGLGPPLRAPASAVQTCSATMKKNTHATMMVGRCGYDKLFPQKKVRKVTARDHGRCNKCTYSSTHCAPSTNTERLHNSGQEANARTTTQWDMRWPSMSINRRRLPQKYVRYLNASIYHTWARGHVWECSLRMVPVQTPRRRHTKNPTRLVE